MNMKQEKKQSYQNVYSLFKDRLHEFHGSYRIYNRFRYPSIFLFVSFLCISCLYFFMLSADVVASSPTKKPICEEDEYFLTSSTEEGDVKLYDNYGNFIKDGRYYIDVGEYKSFYKKNTVQVFDEGDYFLVTTLEHPEGIKKFPSDKYEAYSLDSFYYDSKADHTTYLVRERKTGNVKLYDTDGNILYEMTDKRLIDEKEKKTETENESAEKDEGFVCSLQCKAFPSAHLVGLRLGEYGNENAKKGDFFTVIDAAANKKTKITSPVLVDAFSDGRIRTCINRWFLVDTIGFIGEKGGLYNYDGTLLMEDIYSVTYSEEFDTYYIIQRNEEDDFYSIYDSNLNLYHKVPLKASNNSDSSNDAKESSEDLEDMPEKERDVSQISNGDYFIEKTYKQLNNLPCQGFIDYHTEKYSVVTTNTKIPYALDKNQILAYTGKTLLRIPIEENETLGEVNDAYAVILAKDLDSSNTYLKLLEFQTGKITEDKSIEEIILFDEGCLLMDTDRNYTVKDNHYKTYYDGKSFYNGNLRYIIPNGYFYITRGVYEGIVDFNGNWCSRSFLYEE